MNPREKSSHSSVEEGEKEPFGNVYYKYKYMRLFIREIQMVNQMRKHKLYYFLCK